MKAVDKEVGEALDDRQEEGKKVFFSDLKFRVALTPHHKQGRADRFADSKAEMFAGIKFSKSSIVSQVIKATLKV